jgi:hypothetical protein
MVFVHLAAISSGFIPPRESIDKLPSFPPSAPGDGGLGVVELGRQLWYKSQPRQSTTLSARQPQSPGA